MTTISPRYAIYYAPDPHSAFALYGAETLGYDIFAGIEVPYPSELIGAIPEWAGLTSDARRYGFHATLKAPFALAPGRTEEELITTCDVFAATPRCIPAIIPIVETISGFAAVVPRERSESLDALARACVEAFDNFRAEMTPKDRARRNPAQLTARQIHHLDRWGYPHVFEDFRFHLTLTGRLPATLQTTALAILRKRYATIGLSRLRIDGIVLVRQPNSTSSFCVVRKWLLRSG